MDDKELESLVNHCAYISKCRLSNEELLDEFNDYDLTINNLKSALIKDFKTYKFALNSYKLLNKVNNSFDNIIDIFNKLIEDASYEKNCLLKTEKYYRKIKSKNSQLNLDILYLTLVSLVTVHNDRYTYFQHICDSFSLNYKYINYQAPNEVSLSSDELRSSINNSLKILK